jgi:adenylate cyclase
LAVSSSLRIGKFELRPSERLLLVDGQGLTLGARAFDVLVALVERRDRVVTKSELLDLAWPGVVVEENNLSVQISTLRKVLGSQAIATVTGRGYRLVAPDDGSPRASAAGATRSDAGREITRRLSAIACGEVMGWGAMVAADARAAVLAWKAVRGPLIEFMAPHFGGRIIELAAESLLLEFASAVDAVEWALDLQHRLAQAAAETPAPALRVRLAVTVDDMIFDEERLIGQGVHAARELLAAAQAGQVAASELVHGLVRERAPVSFVPVPAHALPAPLKAPVYLLQSARDHHVLAQTPSPPQLSGNGLPSIAVLPFTSDGEQADSYFGDGVTEEIITSISLNRALLVVARSSTLRYRQSAQAPAQIAAELGVRYLVQGSVRRAQNSLRIGAELIDAASGHVIWAEHYQGSDGELFDFQARIAGSIAAAIDPRVLQAEMSRASKAPTDSLSAYDCVLRGLSVLHTFKGADFEDAGRLFRQAIELDPSYARAHAHLAWWHNLRFGEGRSDETEQDARQAEALSQRAVELDPLDSLALSVAAHVHSFFRRRFGIAIEMFDQALAINPSSAVAWALSAATLTYAGRGDEAIQRARNAMRLSPFDQLSFAFCTTNGTASLVAQRPAEAVVWYSKARRLNPGFRAARRLLVAALALAGERDEARAVAEEFLAAEPDFRVSAFGAWYPLVEPHLSMVLQGMRDGGLPD